MSGAILMDKIGKLGFGYMRLPRNGADFDMEQINKMADTFLAGGGTYFDAAYVYDGAEVALRESVVKRHPRESVQIATKLQMHMVSEPKHMEEQLNTSLERLGTDYIDFYLLHGLNSMTSEKAESMGAWEFFKGLKAKGVIRHIGFSFHGPPSDLDDILSKHPEAEFVQIQVNYFDWENPKVKARELCEVANKHDVPIIVMEPLRGGLLTSEESPIKSFLGGIDANASLASWALRYVAQIKGVFVTLSGMSLLEQVVDNVATFTDLKPLSSDEQAALVKAVEILNGVPRVDCTSCRYCIKDCPAKINIPAIFDVYNNYLVHNTTTNLSHGYGFMTRGGGKAGDCVACRVCEEICPQDLQIVDALAKASALFDK